MVKKFPGKMYIRFICANHADLLSRYNRASISVYNFTAIDALTAQCCINNKDYDKFLEISEKAGADITILANSGLKFFMKRVLKRAILTAGIIGLILCTIYLPQRILFVQVKGNATVSSEKIIAAAEETGIYWGAIRKDIRSEKVKNALISSLPALQWVGVNTYGCVAEISVEEKALPQENERITGISSVIAVADGIIRDITVIRGTPLCTVGQAVKSGQVLISGYTDCGQVLLGTRAQGEVYAETRRSNTAQTPLLYSKREGLVRKNKKFSIQIGKKLIKFYNDSGISDTSCDKMYKKEYVTLPGGFRLPIAFITETETVYRSANALRSEDDFEWLSEQSKDYLLRQAVAGKILTFEEEHICDNGVYTIQGFYNCLEMIGRNQDEESILQNGSYG